MADETLRTPELAHKVRRSIFLSQELEAALAQLAAERGISTNELICDILTRAVASSAGTAENQTE